MIASSKMKPLIMEDEDAELPSVWRKRFLTALKEITDDDTKDEQVRYIADLLSKQVFHNLFLSTTQGGVVPLACKSLEISFLLKLCMVCRSSRVAQT